MAEPEILRESFDAKESRALTETASAAVAAQAQATVQARWIIAQRNPRNWDTVRDRLLKDCKRSSFAEVALYRKPIGAGIVGPSIRFAEAAMRAMTNIIPEVATIYDDVQKRIVRVSVTDLEANLTYSKDVVIVKTIERKVCPKGMTPLSSRYNSGGEKLYILEATDDDILNRENALISKAIRTSGLRLLPGDILDECIDQINETRKAKIAQDPDAARKKILDSFSSMHVPPAEVSEYLGHDVATASPAEIDNLKALYAAIRDGEATWAEAMESRRPAGTDDEKKNQEDAVASLREKIAKAKEKREAAKGAAAPTAAAPQPAAADPTPTQATTAAADAPAPAQATAAAQPKTNGNGIPGAIAGAIRHKISTSKLTDTSKEKFERDVLAELRTEFGDELPGVTGGDKLKRALEIVASVKFPGSK